MSETQTLFNFLLTLAWPRLLLVTPAVLAWQFLQRIREVEAMKDQGKQRFRVRFAGKRRRRRG